VLAQPLFARLKQKNPGLQLDVLAPAWSRAVLECMPEVGTIIASPFGHGELKLAERWRLGRELAKSHYDCAIVLPNSFKSALAPFFADIPLRAGFLGESRYGLLNVRHKLDPSKLPLMVERFAVLAETPGTELPRPLPAPRLSVSLATVNRTLADLGLVQPAQLAIFCPGAEFGPAKRWPTAHFAALAQRLDADGYDVWMVGAIDDFAAGDEIAKAAGRRGRNLCGKTTLTQAIALLSLADRVVTNDSGLMHIAAALDVPMVALFGSSSPEFTPPLSEHAAVVWHHIECSPCFKRECPLGHFKCMNEMTPDEVRQRLEAVGAAS
jgi:heptosyltransferase-2